MVRQRVMAYPKNTKIIIGMDQIAQSKCLNRVANLEQIPNGP